MARAKYQRPLLDYVSVYATSLRQLKKWIAIGKVATPPELPPLDDPASMVEWRRRQMKNSPSADFLAAIAAAVRSSQSAQPTTPSPAAPASAPPQLPPTTPPPPARAAVRLSDVEGIGLAGAAKRLERQLAVALDEYDHALQDANVDEATLNLRAQRVDKLTERLRKVDDTVAKAEEARGELIRLDDLREELAPILASIPGSLVRDLQERLGVERTRAVAFVDEWMRTRLRTRFCEIAPLASAAAPAA